MGRNVMVFIKQLCIYPVKSMQGIALSKASVFEHGFEHDRVLMLCEPDGNFITARHYPNLLKINTSIVDDTIQISVSQSGVDKGLTETALTLNFDDFSTSPEPTQVWGNHFTSFIAPIRVNQFFSDFLQKNVQLRWLGNTLSRRIKRYPDIPLSFADGYPYLLINQASFDYLQQQCEKKLDIRQFRANIIVDGSLPFAEDGWKTIKIGDVIFDIVKPCTRCILTTINAETADYLADNEPLKTLRYFRTNEQGEIDFGMNMIARNQGTISIHDKIEIIERQSAPNYIKSFPAPQAIESKKSLITFEGKTIEGNNKQTILEQLEQHHIALPYSCRTGICGRCQVTLIKGEVAAMTQSSIRRNNKILACSCLPKGDVILELGKKNQYKLRDSD